MLNGLRWHWEGRPCTTVDAAARGKANEIIRPIASAWARGNCADGSWVHIVCVLLVCLNVLPEGDLAVCIEIQLSVEDELRGALCTGDSPF